MVWSSFTPPTSLPAKQSADCFAPRPTAHPDRRSGHYSEMARRVAGAAWSLTLASGTGMDSLRSTAPS